MKTRLSMLLGTVAAALLASTGAHAGAISETLYYTTFSGGENVWKVTATYTGNGTAGNGTFSLSGDTGLAATPGADGLVFNPNNGQLLVGGQGNAIYQVNPGTGTFTSAAPGNNVYELAVDPSHNIVWGGGQEGSDNRLSSTPINPFGGAGSTVTVTGSVSTVTHITFVPGQAPGTAFYTAAGDDGTTPHFGTINLATGVTTDILNSGNTPAGSTWHGMEYDPFTGDIILAGGNELLQIDPVTHAIISSIHIANASAFDQGSVDGKGHLFWADNNGDLLFLDYSNTNQVGNANDFVSYAFFKGSLDDFAPLVGAGGSTDVPEPSTWLLMLSGLAGLGFLMRRKPRLA